jgi:hypothetical protein
MDTVEEIGGTYFYNGMINLSAGELFFWIMVDETMKHFGIDDALAMSMILLGRNDQDTRRKPSGAIKGTSLSSIYSRRIFKKTKIPMGISLPTIIGGPIQGLKIRFIRNLGTFIGRTIPVLGWAILICDVSTISYNTVRRYNQMARGEDKLYGN